MNLQLEIESLFSITCIQKFIYFTNSKLISIFQPQNIVLMGTFPNCDIKVVDLEVARVIKEDEKICEIIGTPDYVGKK